MICLTCERLRKRRKGSFVVDCSVMKLEQIELPKRYVDHIKSIEIENLKNSSFSKTDVGKILFFLIVRKKLSWINLLEMLPMSLKKLNC